MPIIAQVIARKPPRMRGAGCRPGSGNTGCSVDRSAITDGARLKGRASHLRDRNNFHRPPLSRHLFVAQEAAVVRKLIAFDDDTFDKLKQLARDRMATIQELADEAFADVLKKHGIPVDLRDALRKSASRSNTQTKDDSKQHRKTKS